LTRRQKNVKKMFIRTSKRFPIEQTYEYSQHDHRVHETVFFICLLPFTPIHALFYMYICSTLHLYMLCFICIFVVHYTYTYSVLYVYL
jgi:hypothetical protein